MITNWAGNVTYSARALHRPSSLAELREAVARAERVRPLGTGHSFNRLADTSGELISPAALPVVMEIDTAAGKVRVSAGVRYGELSRFLWTNGYALSNLASLPHISVAGAVSTGTHGSGAGNRSLSAEVAAVELVTADGSIVELSEGDDRFPGSVVALGALGVVAALTLRVRPAYEVSQTVFENLPGPAVRAHFTEIMRSAYSVSLFTSWTGDAVDQVWVKSVGEPALELFDAVRADGPRHPIPGGPAEWCTPQLGVPGPWHERLPHFRLEFTPSNGDELQSEYFVPADRAVEALDAIAEIRERIAPVLHISEIRAIAADELWLSPASGRDSVAIHFTWKPDAVAVEPVLTLIEERLAPYAARPHWGKVYGTPPERLAELYPRLGEFAALTRELDPRGKFRNDLLDSLLR
ncbi:MAG: FAD-binding protein [Hamadaea sp.]|uniref:FAD-binding protein n=1 Tax=Hamadaea sp. TaxID=2024425 RepID=UPI0017E0DD82|nr:FAD-binding protein [Hamadaea sp.]NUT19870.1 FAD-binding protein [Hamadaea sp.]